MTWRETTLGEIVTLQRGHDLTEEERRPGNVPVMGSNGRNGWHDTVRMPGPGVTVGRSGASAGVVHFVREDYWPHNTALYVTDFKENSPRFIAYLLSTLDLRNFNSGSAQPSLNRNFLYPLRVYLPDRHNQDRIASILSAYDDLIENNTRRIAVLEEMARRIFEEWFVHFRAPGCETLPRIGTSLGPVPKGWEVVRLSEAFETGSGGTPNRKNSDFYDGSIPWVKTKELGGGAIFETEECISELGLRSSSAKLFPRNTVLVAMYGATIGETSILQVDAATNQACCAVWPKRPGIGWAFTLLMMLVNKGRLVELRHGAAQQNVSQAVIRNLEVSVPSQKIGIEFEGVCQPILSLAFNLQAQNRNLRAQRDLLLPRLISGEIDVSAAPAHLEAAE